jgi:hypothetical protein
MTGHHRLAAIAAIVSDTGLVLGGVVLPEIV